jgi:hypothetical protein
VLRVPSPLLELGEVAEARGTDDGVLRLQDQTVGLEDIALGRRHWEALRQADADLDKWDRDWGQ